MQECGAIATAPVANGSALARDVNGDDIARLRIDARRVDADEPAVAEYGLHAVPDNADD
jgi:hypothetical protein